MKKQITIQISAPIRQAPQILDLFLSQFLYLEENNSYNNYNLQLYYCFIDDNTDNKSTELLNEFSRIVNDKNNRCFIIKPKYYFSKLDEEKTWNWEKIKKVGLFRNNLLDHAKKHNMDYVFMVDSDIILYPNTLFELIDQGKDIITQLHWTEINGGIHPNVWLYDFWDFAFREHYGEHLSRAKELMRMQVFLKRLSNEKLLRVGGLCGCCLIRRSALEKGVRYDQIYNLNTASEDFHFSVRAAALGLSLYVHTNNPAFHIHNDTLFNDAVDFYEKTTRIKYLPLMTKE